MWCDDDDDGVVMGVRRWGGSGGDGIVVFIWVLVWAWIYKFSHFCVKHTTQRRFCMNFFKRNNITFIFSCIFRIQ